MKRKILTKKFFNRPTHEVAQSLIGKFLVRRWQGREVAVMITETEAYDGFYDKGSHAGRGKTKRNEPMFGAPGHWYVYFTYGMHWMLNIVTREEGYPAAVLVRGGREVSGPGRLTKHLHIDGTINTALADPRSGLWIEDRGVDIPLRSIKKSPRVGIPYAGPYWARRHWRFFVTGASLEKSSPRRR